MKKLILVGAFIETIELAQRLKFSIAGYSDNNEKTKAQHGLTCLGDDRSIIESREELLHENLIFVTPDQPKVRERLFNEYKIAGFRFADLISEYANISDSVSMEGSSSIMVQDLVNISSNVEIGKAVRINTGANIMHDCKLGDFITIAPNAVLLGGVKVEHGAYIGANATVLPGVNIGQNAIVGAGAVVTKDVQSNITVVGVPAMVLKK